MLKIRALTKRTDRAGPATRDTETGKIGYVVLWLMGAPVGLLVIVWLILGNNIFSRG
jgi:hypothetical protein